MADITFTPEDFDAVLTIDDLTSYIANLIIDIRNYSVSPKLLSAIDRMQMLSEYGLNNESSINELLMAYNQIQIASIEMRQLLSSFVNLDTYDNIAYAFYYNGQRYSTEHIQANWLIKTSKGELRLQLDKAVESIKQNIEGTAKEKLANIFNKHYQGYLAAISGMYTKATGYVLGQRTKGARLNKGHVAEAYEAHIAQHHSQAYQLLNSLNTSISVIDKMVNAIELELKGDNYWAIHEDPNEAWKHIRGALGTQRGTVAGDVGRYQVKQGTNTNEFSSQVRLASLSTLKNGIKVYCDLVNPDIPVTDAARKLAMYLSEPVKNTEKNIQAYIANKELSKQISNLGKLRHI